MIDFANSVYTLTHTGADTQPVGTTVTETYKAVDQNGEPIKGLNVEFFRTGPDDLQDGDGNSGDYTGNDGKAYYVFQGAKAGTATTTAVVWMYDNAADNWVLVPVAEQADVVKFAGSVKSSITSRLMGHNNGAKRDHLLVNAPSRAHGAVVKLFKITATGRHLVGRAHLNSVGNHRFGVADRNGRRYTKFIAVVRQTPRTLGDTTNIKRVR